MLQEIDTGSKIFFDGLYNNQIKIKGKFGEKMKMKTSTYICYTKKEDGK